MDTTNHDVIRIRVTGTTETTFKGVNYQITGRARGPSGPSAKQELQARIANVLTTVRVHAVVGGVDIERLKTTMVIQSYQEANDAGRWEHRGYEAIYTLAFTGTNVGGALVLHDALTSIEGIEAKSPVFLCDDGPDVHERAFNDAARKASRLFIAQLDATEEAFDGGTSCREYYIASWHEDTAERSGGGKTLMIVPVDTGNGLVRVGVEPGKATFEIHVTFCFARGPDSVRSASASGVEEAGLAT